LAGGIASFGPEGAPFLLDMAAGFFVLPCCDGRIFDAIEKKRRRRLEVRRGRGRCLLFMSRGGSAKVTCKTGFAVCGSFKFSRPKTSSAASHQPQHNNSAPAPGPRRRPMSTNVISQDFGLQLCTGLCACSAVVMRAHIVGPYFIAALYPCCVRRCGFRHDAG